MLRELKTHTCKADNPNQFINLLSACRLIVLLAVLLFPLNALADKAIFVSNNYPSAITKIVFNTMESVPYQSEHLENQGFLVEISKEAFRRVGYDLEIKFVPWKRAMFEAKHGTVDGVLGAWYSEERTRLFE